MAASLAARLRKECQAEVETSPGGLGEFTVLVEGQQAVKTNRLWYPNPRKVFRAVQAALQPESSSGCPTP
jgi:hypothetical protein